MGFCYIIIPQRLNLGEIRYAIAIYIDKFGIAQGYISWIILRFFGINTVLIFTEQGYIHFLDNGTLGFGK